MLPDVGLKMYSVHVRGNVENVSLSTNAGHITTFLVGFRTLGGRSRPGTFRAGAAFFRDWACLVRACNAPISLVDTGCLNSSQGQSGRRRDRGETRQGLRRPGASIFATSRTWARSRPTCSTVPTAGFTTSRCTTSRKCWTTSTRATTPWTLPAMKRIRSSLTPQGDPIRQRRFPGPIADPQAATEIVIQ